MDFVALLDGTLPCLIILIENYMQVFVWIFSQWIL